MIERPLEAIKPDAALDHDDLPAGDGPWVPAAQEPRPGADDRHVLRPGPRRLPQADHDRCTAPLLVEVDPGGLVRDRKGPKGNDFSLAQYVNDRPYAGSSFLSVAINKVFDTAMTGRGKERPEVADTTMPFVVHLPVVPCRGGEAILRRLFEPIGYDVRATTIPLTQHSRSGGIAGTST